MQIARQKEKHSAMPSRLMTVMAEVGKNNNNGKMRWHSNSSYVSVSKVGLGTCSSETYYVTRYGMVVWYHTTQQPNDDDSPTTTKKPLHSYLANNR